MRKILAFLLGVAATMLLTVTPAQAKPDPYQAWLNEVAVTASHNGIITEYTEREVGDPAFQAVMKQRLSGGVSPLVIFWNCQGGVGCTWVETNGGGAKFTASVGQYGINNCNYLPVGIHAGHDSSASADYGSGYDLLLVDNVFPGCVILNSWVSINSSHSANFTGSLAWFNDAAVKFSICDMNHDGGGQDCP